MVLGCDSAPESPLPEESGNDLVPVSLQLQWVTQAQFAGYYIALEKGWYEAEGMAVTIYPGGPDIVPVDLVASGSRDFGTTLLADLALSIQGGKTAIGIAQIQQDNGLRLLAKKSSKIRVPKDLIGKKVGVWLGGWEVQFNALLARQQIFPDQVDVISQGFSMAPFLEGRLDAASAMIYNEYNMVLAQGIARDDLVVIDYKDFGLGFPGDVLFTSNDMVRDHPGLCGKMVRASLRGWQYALKHMDEAVDVVLKHDRAGVADLDHQKKMMEEIARLISGSKTDPMGYISDRTISKMINTLVLYDVLEIRVTSEAVFTSQFVNQPDK